MKTVRWCVDTTPAAVGPQGTSRARPWARSFTSAVPVNPSSEALSYRHSNFTVKKTKTERAGLLSFPGLPGRSVAGPEPDPRAARPRSVLTLARRDAQCLLPGTGHSGDRLFYDQIYQARRASPPLIPSAGLSSPHCPRADFERAAGVSFYIGFYVASDEACNLSTH